PEKRVAADWISGCIPSWPTWLDGAGPGNSRVSRTDTEELNTTMTYSFGALAERSYQAAQNVVPVIHQIVGIPNSIVDLGGGTGAWCRAFKEAGSKQVRCI